MSVKTEVHYRSSSMSAATASSTRSLSSRPPEVDILPVDRLDAPRHDSALGRRPTSNPALLGYLDRPVHPRPRRQRQRNILLPVERTPFVVREYHPRASFPFVPERVAAIDDIASFEDRTRFLVAHSSSSTLGCGSSGACSRHSSLSSPPSWSLKSSFARLYPLYPSSRSSSSVTAQ